MHLRTSPQTSPKCEDEVRKQLKPDQGPLLVHNNRWLNYHLSAPGEIFGLTRARNMAAISHFWRQLLQMKSGICANRYMNSGQYITH